MSAIDSSESVALNYCFLLLAHIICADRQIHSREAKALKELATQAKINQTTLQAVEKILSQDKDLLSLENIANSVPVGQRSEALRQVLAVAYVDGYFSPLERATVDQLSQLWGINQYEIKQMLETAQGFGSYSSFTLDDTKSNLSIGARLLQGTESLLSRVLIEKLAELAPDNIGRQIEKLQREILIAGPEYEQAIHRCAKIAREDYRYSELALKRTYVALQDLGDGIHQVIWKIQQQTTGKGEYSTAKEIAEKLEKTRQSLSADILHDLENVREALRAKQRALNHFSIAFMGRTKAGKSTLHAVITREGWEAIGVGKLRTTRLNRVYEWKNIRIIDTPGIGAPGGKTDEEIASSIVEEADVICYVVTNDSIQETEFDFLKVLKEKTKPLIVLLNLQHNLRHQQRLEHFLRDPNKLFLYEGASGIGGHIKRIETYAREHYANDYLEVIPVMLLAAQLSQEEAHQKTSKQLFHASRIQDFLDSIQVSLIKYGQIRRSQTLLGSTVGSIDKPLKWISREADDYKKLAEKLKEKQKSLQKEILKSKREICIQLQQEINEIFQNAINCIPSFAEEYWESKESQMETGWKNKLQSIKFEQRLKSAPEKASQTFQSNLQEALEEIGNELTLIAELQDEKFLFSEQDTDDFNKLALKFGGGILAVVCLALPLIPVFAPLAPFLVPASIILGMGSQFSNKFKSRGEKRREAVQNISISLKAQLDEQQEKLLKKIKETFEEHCQNITEIVNQYFDTLIQGIEGMGEQLVEAEERLSISASYLNRAYAKRIIDWASEKYEPLTDVAIKGTVHRVDRIFGQKIQIWVKPGSSIRKTPEEIRKVLQENISINTIKI